jgi:KDO2-lipid IV(A) lauroyltransferase
MRRLPAMVDAGAIPVFVIDQNAGDRGEYVPFFGRLTSSHRSLAAFLMQRDAVAVIGAALRLPEPWNLGVDPLHDAAVGRPPDRLHYRCVMTSAIRPEDFKDHPDPAFYITARWRREIEALVRLAPEQYFWMHRVWKSRPEFEINGTGLPGELRDKLQSLPWMTGDEIDRLAEQSARDAAELTRRRSRRLE